MTGPEAFATLLDLSPPNFLVRLNVYGIAPRPLIPYEKDVAHEFQIGYENPLYVYLHPEFYVVVKDLRSPQLVSARSVGCNDVLISCIALSRVPDAAGNDWRDWFLADFVWPQQAL